MQKGSHKPWTKQQQLDSFQFLFREWANFFLHRCISVTSETFCMCVVQCSMTENGVRYIVS